MCRTAKLSEQLTQFAAQPQPHRRVERGKRLVGQQGCW
jgi:hypothetical protein